MNDIAVNPLLDSVVVPAAAALMIVVGLVLLVACANLASFLLAQARDRRNEVAIRLAIGAKRSVLVRQFLVESLAARGRRRRVGRRSLSGVALRAVLARRSSRSHPDHARRLARLARARLRGRRLGDRRRAVRTAARALRRRAPRSSRRSRTRTPTADRARRFTVRNALVVGQVSVSLTLLITALLFLRSLQARATVDPGFGAAPAGMLWLGDSRPIATTRRSRQLLLDDIERRMARIPGVVTVGAIDNILLNSLSQQGKRITCARRDAAERPDRVRRRLRRR